MSEPDEMMVEIGRGIELSQAGERAAAHQVLANLWAQMAPKVTRSIGASWLLDVAYGPPDEVEGPSGALEAADRVDDDRARRAGSVSPVLSVYPLLHLNLGDLYRRLGDLGLARIHLELGQADVGAMGDDGFAQALKAGLDRLAAKPPTV